MENCKLQYQMIALDLDGTLTNAKKEITPYTKEVLMNYQQQGGCIVLASGRPIHGILPLAEELELKKYGGYILAFNGALVYECKTGKTVFQKTFEGELFQKVCCLAKQFSVAMLTYHDGMIMTETPDNEYVQQEVFITKMKVDAVDNLAETVDFPVNKMLLVGDPDYLASVEVKVQESVGDVLSVYRSAPFFLEVMAQNIDKAESLKYLLNYANLKVNDLAAFGDGYNDSSMIRFAGLGVAMANAEQVVKDAADAVTKSNEEDGVGWMVNQFIKNDKK